MNIKLVAISTVLLALASCGSDVKRNAGSIYMPDMAYSRAYETYADVTALKEKGINYTRTPVPGTISRGEEILDNTKADKVGETVQYDASAALVNPITSLTEQEMQEVDRIYQINCGICHGAKMDGNGPLWKDGAGPYPAKPATLVGDAKYTAMAPGTMYFSISHGRNLMGSYASQLTPKERWQVVYLIKSKQSGSAAPAPAAAPADSTAAK